MSSVREWSWTKRVRIWWRSSRKGWAAVSSVSPPNSTAKTHTLFWSSFRFDCHITLPAGKIQEGIPSYNQHRLERSVFFLLKSLLWFYSDSRSEFSYLFHYSLRTWNTLWVAKPLYFICAQNADDNSYPQGRKEDPALAFVVQNNCITILNNECGFEEKNVRAICDVGKSTKGKHTCGYIGKQHASSKDRWSVVPCGHPH